jgi:hypothetical protein
MYLRKSFFALKIIASTYVTSHGYYELSINSEKSRGVEVLTQAGQFIKTFAIPNF